MEKKDQIRSVIESYFQCQLSEAISDNELEVLLQNQNTKEEKFILLSLAYKLNNPSFGLERVEEFLGVKLINHEGEVFQRFTSLNKQDLFAVLIFEWLKMSTSPETIVLTMCALRKEKDENKLKILNGILNIYFHKGNKLNFLCRSFHLIVENIKNLPYVIALLKMVTEMILEVDKKGEVLISLYWYYSYVNAQEIVEMLSTFIVSLNIDHTQDFSWQWCDHDKIKVRYEKIVAAKSDISEKRLDTVDKISSKLEASPVSLLVPLVLYARKMNNTEIESWIMRFVWKKQNTKGIISRLGELSGFNVPNELLNLNSKAQGSWIANRINESYSVSIGKRAVTKESILSVKKIYTIQPFNPSVISALIMISATNNDEDVEKMLNTSIGATSSYIFLGKILTHALNVGSQSAVFLILKRLATLKFYETILFAVENIDFYSARKNPRTMKSIKICLDFYNQVTPTTSKNNFRANKLTENYHGVNYDKEAYMKVKLDFNNEKQVIELYDRQSYDELFGILIKKTLSVKTLKVILQAAINLKSPKRILEAYEALVRLDPAAASFYNSDVEPFIIISNKYAKFDRNSNSLVSTIWGVPANFSEPIDRKTGLLSGKAK